MARFLTAFTVAAMVTCLLVALSGVFPGWFGTRGEAIGAGVLGFVATYRLARPGEMELRRNLLAATGIALAVLIGVVLGRAAETIAAGGTVVPREALDGLLALAVATVWWLIPAIAALLAMFGRIGARMRGVDLDERGGEV